MYLQGDQIDVTPAVCCYRCHHLYYDMYLDDMCRRDGVSKKTVFSFKGFGEETRSISCPKFVKRSQPTPAMISVIMPEQEYDENFVRFMGRDVGGNYRVKVDGMWVWFRKEEGAMNDE